MKRTVRSGGTTPPHAFHRGAGDARGEGEKAAGGRSPEPEVRIQVTDSLDLHTFHPRDVPDVVEEYLREAQRLGFREVRIIHGKGTGRQREAVARVLERHPAVASYGIAPAGRGHWGATIVTLKQERGGDHAS